MAGYGHQVRFGVMLEPSGDWGHNALAWADLAEQAGLDLVSLADHPYWAEQLTSLTLSAGVSGYVLYRAGSAGLIERFAAEVAPAVREAVAAERAR